ncbi:uncharacterized transposon-derived protein F54H12.3 [Trichonephila clavata]|uniref:Uncharacterized transposon-derived protein F54H12.3 n=1 Tax=Trichonephila clavata TaxID=2740835 RepID=A0A8X6JID0_TRICU|nr:uncharacterized transposon-derived protein F54H12.3 [Trichonephila clavata]
MERVLKTAYYDFVNPASFGGIKKLSTLTKVPYQQTKAWLSSQDTYTLHRPVRYKFSRRATLSYGINDLWQCDLVDLQHLAEHNNGFRFSLTIIDVFSKFAYVIPLKNKKAVSVTKAFESLLQQVKPKNIQSNKGNEFYNTQLQSLFKKYNINHYSAEGDAKSTIVERFNRTLKQKCSGFSRIENRIMRISKANKLFRRGYLPGWSDEVFTVAKVYHSYPTTYKLQDMKAESIKGRFYAEELQKISKRSDDYWHVEKVLKTKGSGRKKEYYVKWKGFDNRFNSWVKAAWMK